MLLRFISDRLFLTACLALALLSSSLVSADNLYYRYPDVRGNIVIDSKVPPEAIPRGYDVIRVDGSVVKTVAPKLTEQEQREMARELEIAAARAEAEEKMRKWDESLLLRYSDPADIEVAKKRALHNIRVRISILESNLAVIKRQITKNQRDAAELEREGREVPQALSDTINDLRREAGAMEQQIAQRKVESEDVAENYEQDKARFLLLQERLRRQRGY